MSTFAFPLLLTLLALLNGGGVDVVDVDEKTSGGILQEMDGEKTALAAGSQMLSFPVDRILSIKPQTVTAKAESSETFSVVHLLDSSRIVVNDLTMSQKTAELTRANGTKISVELDQIELVRFQVKSEEISNDIPGDLQKIVRVKSAEDRLLVAVENALDYYGGVIREIDTKTIKFELDGEILSVNRGKVVGLIFHQTALPQTMTPFCQLSERDGSHWTLAEIRYDSTQEAFRWKTVLGIEGVTPFGQWASADFAKKNTAPLLSLTPIAVRYSPLANWTDQAGQGPLALLGQMSKSVLDHSGKMPENEEEPIESHSNSRLKKTKQLPLTTLPGIQLDGKVYPIGYTLPAKTELEFLLEDEYQTLRGIAGIDDRIRPNGRVKLVISGNDTPLYETIIRGDHATERLNVSLKGVKKLTIIADFPDGLDNGSRLNLVEMLLQK